MIHRVIEQVKKVKLVDKIIVATDDLRIFSHVEKLGFEARMTAENHASGTDRVAEIATQFIDYQIVINVQGDEPFIQPEQIERLILFLKKEKKVEIATLAKRIGRLEDLQNPNVVKVVFSEKTKRAIYFSRHPIPFTRGHEPSNWLEKTAYFKHIGLYGFRRETLLIVAKLPNSPLETAESLEQLRWLEAGFSIGILETDLETRGIDVPADLDFLT
jgi:3-deoxy-manno-octulosonate cytidylyltransferase (CMP-KDO synthetase)